jgi:hypothetical protein
MLQYFFTSFHRTKHSLRSDSPLTWPTPHASGTHHTCMSERLLRAPTLTCQKPREPTPTVSHVQRQITPSLMLVTVLTNVITQCKLHILLLWVFISPFDMFRYLRTFPLSRMIIILHSTSLPVHDEVL